jgi:hypothetical protein
MRQNFLESIRLWLRCNWLALVRDLEQLVTKCVHCGSLGAYPCSIAACIKLCTACQKEETIWQAGIRTRHEHNN